MSAETIRLKFWLNSTILAILILSVSACKVKPTGEATPQPSSPPLTPYHTPTPTQTPNTDTGENPIGLVPTQPPAPTATPFLYTIRAGDTFLAIAQRYNIPLDKLLAANPQVDPNFLIIGTDVIIPTGEGSQTAFPLPTPISVELGQPHCYPTADGGLWCLVMAQNPHSQDVENISASITLYDPAGEQVGQQIALTPLNVVPAGEAIPLAVLFPEPVPEKTSAQAELVAALPIEPASERYVEITIEIEKTEFANSFGEVDGRVRVDDARPANRLWLAAIALGADGQPIGFRKWESNNRVAPGETFTFHITVYSLGPPIAEIRVSGEARP
ncbi:MAG: LysM peptidoglycan-binding domain-containing protein [Chloroflexi bacterium]|nr:LysM peptidoglycan-binding domain-containing protein [Chloroflexota bacterium]